jgi:hypothetical protein
VLYLLAVLSRCRNQENHTSTDKPGILQGLRNMHAGMPGKSHNHGVRRNDIISSLQTIFPVIASEAWQSQVLLRDIKHGKEK